MTFARDVRRSHARVRRRTQLAIQKITIEAANIVILKSPVDTGRFRGNWNVTIGSIDYTTNDALDPSGDNFRRKAEFTISDFDVGQVLYISNNLPYARRLEFGYSDQAPSPPGIVRAAAAETRIIQRQVFSQLRP